MRYSLLLLFCLVAGARADIVIFSAASTNRVTGLNRDYKVIVKGKIVVDAETGFRAAVGWFVLDGRKWFFVDTAQPLRATVVGSSGATTTVSGYSDMNAHDWENYFYVTQLFGRGVNTPLAIRPNRFVSFPAVFQTTEKSIEEYAEGFIVVEGRGVTRFGRVETQTANARNETLDQVIDRTVAGLVARGFTQL